MVAVPLVASRQWQYWRPRRERPILDRRRSSNQYLFYRLMVVPRSRMLPPDIVTTLLPLVPKVPAPDNFKAPPLTVVAPL